jgi:hypothetical protein
MDSGQSIVGWGKLVVAAMILNGIMMFGFVSSVYADDDRAECRHRIQKARRLFPDCKLWFPPRCRTSKKIRPPSDRTRGSSGKFNGTWGT